LNMRYFGIQYANPFNFRVKASDDQSIAITKVLDQTRLVLTCNHFGKGLVDMSLEIYNGSAYAKVIREDTFQAELDDYLKNPPVEDSANTAPTSEWAYDHWKDTDLHGSGYTDAKVLAAPGGTVTTLLTGAYYDYDVSGIAIFELMPSGGDITLGGFSNGFEGQFIWFVRRNNTNNIIIDHGSVHVDTDEPIYTKTGANETQAAGQFGGFRMIKLGSLWYVDREIT
ncbi:unnamed protein product, partial [marine sediment metagenome]